MNRHGGEKQHPSRMPPPGVHNNKNNNNRRPPGRGNNNMNHNNMNNMRRGNNNHNYGGPPPRNNNNNMPPQRFPPGRGGFGHGHGHGPPPGGRGGGGGGRYPPGGRGGGGRMPMQQQQQQPQGGGGGRFGGRGDRGGPPPFGNGGPRGPSHGRGPPPPPPPSGNDGRGGRHNMNHHHHHGGRGDRGPPPPPQQQQGGGRHFMMGRGGPGRPDPGGGRGMINGRGRGGGGMFPSPPPPPPPVPPGVGGGMPYHHHHQQQQGGGVPPPPPPPRRGGNSQQQNAPHQLPPTMMMQHHPQQQQQQQQHPTGPLVGFPPNRPQQPMHSTQHQHQHQQQSPNGMPHPQHGIVQPMSHDRLRHPQQQQQRQQMHPSSTQVPFAPQNGGGGGGGGNVTDGPTATNMGQTQSDPSSSKINVDQAWTEHESPDGIKYYYNAILKESVYDKPECLQNPSSLSENSPKEEPLPNEKERTWSEILDPSTGNYYYSDGVTTTWDKPDWWDKEDHRGGGNTKRKYTTPNGHEDGDSSSSINPRKKRKSTPQEDSHDSTDFQNKTEAIAAFKGMLLAKGISPTMKWNDSVKICSSDMRWKACEKVLAIGERKQALAEYQTKRANELRDLERQERMRAKDAYLQLLASKLPKLPGFSPVSSEYTSVRDSLSSDDRFYAVDSEDKRERLFHEYCEEVRKSDERKIRNEQRDAKNAFLSFLKEREEAGDLTIASTWNLFLASLDESIRSDARCRVSAAMTDGDQELYFADYVLELQAAEDDRRNRIRDARRRAEKAQREEFRDALRRMASEGLILPSSRWRNVEDTVAADKTHDPVQAQDRDIPRSLFEDFVGEWSAIFHKDRSFLSQLVDALTKKKIIVTEKTSHDDFVKDLLDEASHSTEELRNLKRIINSTSDPVSSVRLYYDELVMSARDASEQGNRPRSKRRGFGRRVGSSASPVSSEDEGEILEDGEVEDNALTSGKNQTV